MSVKEEIGQIITDAQVETAALQTRVKELEAEVFEWQSMQHNKEIIRLRKVVDAAIRILEDAKIMQGRYKSQEDRTECAKRIRAFQDAAACVAVARETLK